MDTQLPPSLKKIRFARWEDMPRIQSLLEEEFADNPAETREWIKDIENNMSLMLVCLEGDELAGFGGLRFLDETVCVLQSDFVAADRRGRGVGSLLVFARLAMLDTGDSPLEVGVVTRANAEGFYKRLGFAPEGESVLDPILNQPVCRLHRTFYPEDIATIEKLLDSRSDILLALEEDGLDFGEDQETEP